MYAFAQRSDCRVFDEPLYAAYLAAYPQLERPYRAKLLATGQTDCDAVLRDTVMGPSERGRPVRLYKHIASQLQLPLSRSFLSRSEHVLLVRHPFRVVASYLKTNGSVTADDTGLPQLAELHAALRARGYEPLVVDNATLLAQPEATLRAVCARLGIAFEPAMLHWKKGGIPEDGLWAYHWYHATHASTGFDAEPASQRAEDESVLEGLPQSAKDVARAVLPLYHQLHRCRLLLL